MTQVQAAGTHDECHAIFRYHMHMRVEQRIRRMMLAWSSVRSRFVEALWDRRVVTQRGWVATRRSPHREFPWYLPRSWFPRDRRRHRSWSGV